MDAFRGLEMPPMELHHRPCVSSSVSSLQPHCEGILVNPMSSMGNGPLPSGSHRRESVTQIPGPIGTRGPLHMCEGPGPHPGPAAWRSGRRPLSWCC